MTPHQFLGALRRRWYALVVVLAVTAVVMGLLPRDSNVFWARVSVVFLPPISPAQVGNVLEGSDPSLIYFAAAVQRAVTAGEQSSSLSSSTATLYGTGVRQGHSVTLVNSGGQWTTNFNRPVLKVEVVDTTADRTQQALDALLSEINQTAAQLQTAAGSPERQLIRTELSPQVPAVTQVSNNPKRALAATLVLGLGLSAATGLAVERLAVNRSRRRRRDAGPLVDLAVS